MCRLEPSESPRAMKTILDHLKSKCALTAHDKIVSVIDSLRALEREA